jgi:hypothetical protein
LIVNDVINNAVKSINPTSSTTVLVACAIDPRESLNAEVALEMILPPTLVGTVGRRL